MTQLIRLGCIDLSFHVVSAALIQVIFEHYGFQVEIDKAPHEETFQRFDAARVDILVSAWLPASHGAYLAALKRPNSKVTVLYEPYCIWGVPDYIPEHAIKSITDLTKPEILKATSRCIQGINAGAGISRFSKAIIQQYGLDSEGYFFAEGAGTTCFDRYERSYAAKEWFVVPLWHPQFLHHRYAVRALEDPLGLLGGRDEATLIVADDLLEKLPGPLIEDLRQLRPGNAVISQLDHGCRYEDLSPHAAAERWMQRHQ